MKKVMITALVLLLAAASASAQKMAIGNNVADDLFLGTLNLQAQYAVGQHWSLTADVKYNPWTFHKGEAGNEDSMSSQLQARQRSAALGARWWPWHIYSGWWVAGKAKWQEYNSNFWCVNDQIVYHGLQTEEGTRAGLSLGFGYSFMLTSWFDLDVGVSGWGGGQWYSRYACPTCGRLVESGVKGFLLPDELTLALIFIF